NRRFRIALVLSLVWAASLGAIAWTSYLAACSPSVETSDYTNWRPGEPIDSKKLSEAVRKYRLHPRIALVQELGLKPSFDWGLTLVQILVPVFCIWGLCLLAGSGAGKPAAKHYRTDMDETVWLEVQKYVSKIPEADRHRADLRN